MTPTAWVRHQALCALASRRPPVAQAPAPPSPPSSPRPPGAGRVRHRARARAPARRARRPRRQRRDVAYQPAAAFLGRLRGECLNLLLTPSGNRLGRGLVRPGGVQLDLPETMAGAMRTRLE